MGSIQMDAVVIINKNVIFDSVSASIERAVTVYDITNDKLVITYDSGSFAVKVVKSVVCTVVGDVVTHGTPVEIMAPTGGRVNNLASAYDETTGKIVVMSDIISSSIITSISIGTVSGTTITFAPFENVRESHISSYGSAVFNSSTEGVTFTSFSFEFYKIMTLNVNPSGDGIKVIGPSPVVDLSRTYVNVASAYDSLNDRVIVIYVNTLGDDRPYISLYGITPAFFWTNNQGHSERG